MAAIEIIEVLNYYNAVVVNGDLPKLKKIAEDSERLNSSVTNPHPQPFPEVTRPVQVQTTTILTTSSSVSPTTRPVTPSGNRNTEDARCTIPMAMMLLSTVEILGSILNIPYKFDFRTSIKNFMDYAGHGIDDNEKEILTFIHRNGMMHGFFPQGSNTGVSYDSRLNDTSILVLINGSVVLNVKALAAIVSTTLQKLILDTSRHEDMEEAFNKWYTEYSDKDYINPHIEAFKANYSL